MKQSDDACEHLDECSELGKDRLDRNRAPGQCYDGFLCQMADLWEEVKNGKRGNPRKSKA